ncbi:GGDEF domain-containing protein [Deinococcus koreensis]|nr:diguanylate cyclase [Deinococcus koreensis]
MNPSVMELIERGWAERHRDPGQTQRLGTEALSLAEALQDRAGIGYAQRNLGTAAFFTGDLRAALDHLGHALTLARELGDLTLERDCANFLAGVYSSLYNYDRAAESCLRALELSRTLSDPVGEANAYANLGVIHVETRQYRAALPYLQQALERQQRLANAAGVCNAAQNLTECHLMLGEVAQAQHSGELTVTVARQIGFRRRELETLSKLGKIADALGEHDRAAELHQQALKGVSGLQVPESEIWVELEASLNQLALGQLDEAGRLLEQARQRAEDSGLSALLVEYHRRMATLERRRGELEAALDHLERAHRLERSLLDQEVQQRSNALMIQYEVERVKAEAELYRLRTVELAQANAQLERANQEKSALVAALEAQSLALERQLREDALTGVYNRRHIEVVLQEVFRAQQRAGRPLTVVMADIDNFKRINDTCSHPVGDQVLRQVAGLLRDGCGPHGTVARYGGEEFLLVLPDSTREQGLALCERLCQQVQDFDWSTLHPHLRVTLSLGLSARGDVPNHEKLVAAADERLYEAKRAGRNRVAG